MIRIVYALMLIQSLCQLSWAQSLQFSWGESMGGANAIGNAAATIINITHDAAGNVIVTGTFQDTVDFDPGPGVANLQSLNGTDVFVLKLDVLGDFIWVKQLAGSDNEGSTGVAVAGNGDILVLGEFKATLDADPSTSTAANIVSAGAEDVFLVRLDAAGGFLWARRFGGTQSDRGNTLTLDSGGDILIAGNYRGTADFDPGSGVVPAVSAGVTDAWLVKLSTGGQFQWLRTFGAALADDIRQVKTDALGNVYCCGTFSGSVDFDPAAPVTVLQTPAQNPGAVIWKLSAAGNFSWAKALLPIAQGGGVLAAGITIGVNNSIVVSGTFEDAADVNPDAGVVDSVLSASPGSADVYLLKLNSSGGFQWCRTWGNAGIDACSPPVTDAVGNIFLKGSFSGTIDIDPDPSSALILNSGSATGSRSEYLSLMSTNGNLLWAGSIDGFSVGFRGNILDVDQSRYYAGGQFTGTLDVDPNGTVFNLNSVLGTASAYLVQLTGASNALMTLTEDSGPLTIYPNPASGKVIVMCPAMQGSGTLLVSNALGQVVKEEGCSLQEPFLLDLSGQLSGTYIVQLITSSGVFTNRLVIQP